jgi:antitoxin component of MazEF toxin-antitoxin module
MRITLRKVGNSLGVIIPKAALDSWGLREGDTLQLSERGLSPVSSGGTSHESLDELKRKLAFAVASSFTPQQIRAQSLANLHRWRKTGVWVSAYDEWKQILEGSDDGELLAAMLGRDEHSNRLRQSPPYVGLLAREEVKRLNEEATR